MSNIKAKNMDRLSGRMKRQVQVLIFLDVHRARGNPSQDNRRMIQPELQSCQNFQVSVPFQFAPGLVASREITLSKGVVLPIL